MITRERFLAAASDIRPKAIEVKALGGTVYIRPVTLAMMAGFSGDKLDPAMRMLISCVCDEKGAALFSEADATELGGLSRAIVEPIISEINKMSGVDEKAVEDAVKK
jgi:hypothetical protein